MTGKVWWAVVACGLAALAGGRAVAGGSKDPTADLPPLVVPPADGGLPTGTPVSKPLQPVRAIEPAVDVSPAPAAGAADKPAEFSGPLGSSWQAYEYLLWWPKTQPLPPLAATAPGPAQFGGSNALLLIGPDSASSPSVSGGRFRLGFSVDDAQTTGLEVGYLFLGTRTQTVSVSDLDGGHARYVGRPLVNPATGQPGLIPVSVPGSVLGELNVSTSTRVTGWEATAVTNLYAGPRAKLNALAGYRYFMVNEGLRVDQLAVLAGTSTVPPTQAAFADQFDAHNRFHGGQVGLQADLTRGPLFLEATAKVALGAVTNVVQVSGQAASVGYPYATAQTYNGGVLGQPTNSGRFAHTGFGVLPEAVVKAGYQVRDRARVYIGYNFIYLSEAVRPGDQVDLRVDPGQVPVFGKSSSAADRPAPVLTRSDFWVQGLLFGLEYRY